MADNSATKWMPTAGGVINIITGLLGFIGSLFLGFLGIIVQRAISTGFIEEFPRLGDLPAAFFWFLAVVVFVLSMISLIGGIYAVQRKGWGMALAGSICSILHSNVLGIIATIFIAMSRSEFKS